MGRAQTKVLVIGGLVLGMSVIVPLLSKLSDWLVPVGVALFAALVVWAVVAMLSVLKAPPRRRPLTATVRLDWKPIEASMWEDKVREPWEER